MRRGDDVTQKAVVLARMRRAVRSGEARELRVTSGLSLREVAEDIGTHLATIHRWEQGICLPRGPHAVRYARLLDELTKVIRDR